MVYGGRVSGALLRVYPRMYQKCTPGQCVFSLSSGAGHDSRPPRCHEEPASGIGRFTCWGVRGFFRGA